MMGNIRFFTKGIKRNNKPTISSNTPAVTIRLEIICERLNSVNINTIYTLNCKICLFAHQNKQQYLTYKKEKKRHEMNEL